jgi:hypothetical protein
MNRMIRFLSFFGLILILTACGPTDVPSAGGGQPAAVEATPGRWEGTIAFDGGDLGTISVVLVFDVTEDNEISFDRKDSQCTITNQLAIFLQLPVDPVPIESGKFSIPDLRCDRQEPNGVVHRMDIIATGSFVSTAAIEGQATLMDGELDTLTTDWLAALEP